MSPQVTTKVTWECVHQASEAATQAEVEACKERGFSVFPIDATAVTTKEKLLAEIQNAMAFPYSGMNWDALIDCLRDLSWLEPRGVLLVLRNSRALWCQTSLSAPLIECWLISAEYWGKEAVPFHLIFTWE